MNPSNAVCIRLWLALALLSACASRENQSVEDVVEPATPSDSPSEEAEDAAAILEAQFADTLEDDFCYDDIYTSYLRTSFLKGTGKTPSGFNSVRQLQRRQKSLDLDATYYARRVLVGPLSPYFGAIPVVSNERVEQWVRYFKTEGRPAFIKWMVRAQSFQNIVAPVLAAQGLPPELFFLAMIESGFSNTASSTKRATGTWQFMKGTAELYKLKINYWIDERRDPIKSTVAAASYLRDLYAQFGDWYLAMAAYNAGPGKVRSAIRKAGSTDFWKIAKTPGLRPETKNYVPKVLAALILNHYASQHGFDIQEDPGLTLPLSHVELDRPIALDELAKSLDVPLSSLRYWNPELIRNITPPTRGTNYRLRLPPEYQEKFAAVRDTLSFIEVTDVVMHKVRSGDTLSAIARRYGVSIPKIKELNPNLNPRTLRIGHQLAIPVPGVITKKPGHTEMG